MPDEEIWEVFQSFDLDSTGTITLLEFTRALKTFVISKKAVIHLILINKNQYKRKEI